MEELEGTKTIRGRGKTSISWEHKLFYLGKWGLKISMLETEITYFSRRLMMFPRNNKKYTSSIARGAG